MIDIKFLRENPDVVKENIKKKFQDEKIKLVDEVIELDLESRRTQQEADDLRANRNKIIPILIFHRPQKQSLSVPERKNRSPVHPYR